MSLTCHPVPRSCFSLHHLTHVPSLPVSLSSATNHCYLLRAHYQWEESWPKMGK